MRSPGIFINLNGGFLTLLFLAGLSLFVFALVKGITSLLEFMFPVFLILGALSILSFIFVLVPLTVIKKLHPQLILASGLLSGICGISVWMYSFVVTVKVMGGLAIFLIFLFNFIAPLAAISLFVNGQSMQCAAICFGLLFTYLMKAYSLRLTANLQSKSTPNGRGETIDIEANVED